MKNTILLSIVFVSILTTIAIACEPNLVAYWKFDEGSGTIAYDKVGNNHGTVYDAQWTTGKVGGALYFDGDWDYVDVPDNNDLRLPSALTIEAWTYPIFDGGDYYVDVVVAKGQDVGWGPYFNYRIAMENSGIYTWGVSNARGELYFHGGMPLYDTWQHLALTADGTVCKAYLNGVEIGSVDAPGSYLTFPGYPLQIGGHAVTSARWFSGLIDEVAIFNRTLSAEEIQQHYQNGLSGLPYPVLLIADAGPDQYFDEIELITLDGSNSCFYDPNGIKEYLWTQISGPEVELSDENAVKPTFLPLKFGAYIFELVVSDTMFESCPDTVAIVVGADYIPIADAGLTRYAAIDPVQLDGSASYDPDGSGPLSYQWQQISGPPVSITDQNSPTPTITDFIQNDSIQTCQFELIVSDGDYSSLPDTVEVVIVPASDNGDTTFVLENTTFDFEKPTIIYFGGGDCVSGGGSWSGSAWKNKANIISFSHYNPDGWPDYPSPRVYFQCGDQIITYLSSVAPHYNRPIQTMGCSTGGQPAIDAAIHLNLTYKDPRFAVNRVVQLDASRYCRANYSPSYNLFINNPVDGEQCWIDNYDSAYARAHPYILNIGFDTYDHGLAVGWYANSLTDPDMNIFNNGIIAGAYWSVIGPGKNLQLVAPYYEYYFYWFGDAASGYMTFYDESRYPGRLPEPITLLDPAAGGTLDPNYALFTCEESENAVGYQLLFGADPYRVADYNIISDTPHPPNDVTAITMLPYEQTWWTIKAYDRYGSNIHADPILIDNFLLSRPIHNLSTGKRYGYIQHAIEDANDGDHIVVGQGHYNQTIDFKDKNFILRSTDPNDPNVVAATVINGSNQAATVTFAGGQDSKCVLSGLTVSSPDTAIYCYDTFPTITNCIIDANGGIAIDLWHTSDPAIINCTIIGDVIVRPFVKNLTKGRIYDYIQEAIVDANNGDQLEASEGIFQENINLKGKNLILRSTDPNDPAVIAATIIKSDGPESIVTFSGGEEPNCLFTGFTITRGSGGIYCKDSSPTITNCDIVENGGDGIWLCDESHPTITKCIIADNGGAGIQLFDGSYAPIENCIISDNGADGIHYEGDSLTTGPTINNCIISENKAVGINFYCSEANINNCTITGNGAEGIVFRISFLTITNCILWDNLPPQILKVDLGTVTVNYSDIQGGWAGQYNINADPCFVEPQCWDPNQGLVSYWKFDEGSGDIASDSVGDNNGIVHGGVWTTGQVGGALGFDGVEDYVDICDDVDLDLPGRYTIMFWVNFNSLSYYQGVLTKEDYVTERGYSFQLVSHNQLRWRVNNSTKITGPSMSVGIWTHIAVTTDGIEDIFYVNGVEKAREAHTAIKNNDKKLMFGKREFSDGDQYFDGLLDEVIIYKRGLPFEEIQQHYQAGLDGHSFPTNPNSLSGYGDYHLLQDSQCINAGDPNYVAEPNETDLDGRPRILLGRIDMGAYEFNHIPVADAGPNQVAYADFTSTAEVILDGSASFDGDGDPLTYLWSWNIDSNTYHVPGVGPTIELPIGEHIIELIVNDGIDDSEPDEVVITVIPPPVQAEMKFTPKMLNCKSKSNWVKAQLILPDGFTYDDVDVNEPAYAEVLDTKIHSEYIKLLGNNPIRLEIAFDRQVFCELLMEGDSIMADDVSLEITVVGYLTTGQYFYGCNTIRLKRHRR